VAGERQDDLLDLDFAFDWSDKIIYKLWEKHKVFPWEVEEAIFDDPHVEIRYHYDEAHGGRRLARGRTKEGRRLRIYMKPCKDRKGLWFVITAWGEGE